MFPRFPKYPFFAPEGDDNGASGGSGDPDSAAAEKAAAEQRFAALEKAVGVMAEGHQHLTSALTTITSKLDTLSSGQPRSKEEHQDGEDVDLETLDRKQFAGFLLGKVKSVVEEAVKPLGDKFGQLDEKIDGHSLATMIREFQKDHPDFYEWKDEMKLMLKDHPTLTPARAYALARGESPDKARKLDEKYGLGKPEKKANGSDSFLSLFPNAGNSGSATKGAGKMSPKQAAEAAWDEVMSSLGQ